MAGRRSACHPAGRVISGNSGWCRGVGSEADPSQRTRRSEAQTHAGPPDARAEVLRLRTAFRRVGVPDAHDVAGGQLPRVPAGARAEQRLSRVIERPRGAEPRRTVVPGERGLVTGEVNSPHALRTRGVWFGSARPLYRSKRRPQVEGQPSLLDLVMVLDCWPVSLRRC